MTATKEKRVKIREERPPQEIVSNTKARRAWLAAKLAEIQSTKDLDGKIVGIGSYQVVSVYSVSQVEGRLRHRGHCQYCGASQVVDGGTMVLHGYKRPGDGELIGRCPGMKHPPLQIENTMTLKYLALWTNQAMEDEAESKAAKQAEKETLHALFGKDHHESLEKGAYEAKPHLPPRATPEQTQAHWEALKNWRKTFPLHAAHEAAQARYQTARNEAWSSKCTKEHFEILIKMGLTGTPLIEEVVA